MTWLKDPETAPEHADHDHVEVSIYADEQGEPWVVLLLTRAGEGVNRLPLPEAMAEALAAALLQAAGDVAILKAGGQPDWAEPSDG